MSASVGAPPAGSATVLFDARATTQVTTADPTREVSFDVALDRAGRARPARADRDAREERQTVERPSRDRPDDVPHSRRADHPAHPEHPEHPVHPDRPVRSRKASDREGDSAAKPSDAVGADANAAPVAATPADQSALAAALQAALGTTVGATGVASNGADVGVSAIGAEVAAINAAGATSSNTGAGQVATEAGDAVDLGVVGGLAQNQRQATDPAGDKKDVLVGLPSDSLASVPAGSAPAVTPAADLDERATPTAAVASASPTGSPPTEGAPTDHAQTTQLANASQPDATGSSPNRSGLGHRSAGSANGGAPTDTVVGPVPADSRARGEIRSADDGSPRRPDDVVGGVRFDPAAAQVGNVRQTGAPESVRPEARLTGAERRDAVEQVLDRAQLFSTAGGRGATLRLDPPELGMLHVRVVVEAGRVSLHIATETPQARDIIKDGWSRLQEGFAERGLRVEHLVVEQASAGNGTGLSFGTTTQGGYAWGRQGGDPEASFASSRGPSRGQSKEPGGDGRPSLGPAGGGRGALIDVRV